MKTKCVIITCLVVIGLGSSILFSDVPSMASSSTTQLSLESDLNQSQVTSVVSTESVTTVDIGAAFPQGSVVLTPGTFSPIISKEQAIETVNGRYLRDFSVDPSKYPVEATVAYFSGEINPATHQSVNNVAVWIVVLKHVEYTGSLGPMIPSNQSVSRKIPDAQFNAIIDASTGVVLFCANTARFS